MKVHLDFLVIDTFARIAAVRAYLRLLEKAIPVIEREERDHLSQTARNQNWEYADYDVERQSLDAQSEHWIPRFAAYSAVTLLHTVVETQLVECAEQISQITASRFTLKDLKGQPIDAAALLIARLTGHKIKKDPGWQELHDLRQLRNLVVHRGVDPQRLRSPQGGRTANGTIRGSD